ncbi:MAG: hypothetical protein A2938_01330 [Candidatus Taylorbacteria bacterium RIFCSPLOWO2_01_FULL_48_100]|uniref:HEAT repeat domain-containing protein n=1 Tax=Candidatus Taylorbacteria bacterium RIFCSPLOWO2_01_FULL_48_100 TaxID=1802322 RepID=A0A1G2NG04_9BACT|nr:MAG: hypothetical protein A2938_01330 [Candidatus Taylorbacteria bacterium RIFCSPLOWO2_01_FULL_48_100]
MNITLQLLARLTLFSKRQLDIDNLFNNLTAQQIVDLAKAAGDSDVSKAAVQALGNKLNDLTAQQIVDLAKAAGDSDVSKAAVQALGNKPDGTAQQIVDLAKAAGDWRVSQAAVQALGKFELKLLLKWSDE